MCRMLRCSKRQCIGGLLLRAEGRPPPYGSAVRLSGSCTWSGSAAGHALTWYMQVLKRDCVAALRRIFKLCDTNKDGVLDGQELNEFQVSRTHSLTKRIIKTTTYRANALTHHCKHKNWKASRRWSGSIQRAVLRVTV